MKEKKKIEDMNYDKSKVDLYRRVLELNADQQATFSKILDRIIENPNTNMTEAIENEFGLKIGKEA